MAQSLYNRLPFPAQMLVSRALGLVPARWRQRRITRQVLAFLHTSELWSREQWRAFQDRKVRELVAYAYENVPYYRETWKGRGIAPADVDGVEALRLLPTINNQVVSEHLADMTARGIPERARIYMTTGGTMGRPTRFLMHRRISQDTEAAYIQDMWRRVGYRVGDRRIILRVGADPGRDRTRVYYFDARVNAYCFRSFYLAEENLAQLVRLIREFRPKYIHSYPSAVTVLCQYVQRQGITDLPPIEAALCSSENFHPEQRELVARCLKARLFSWYGHAEQLVLAGECEHSPHYHVYPGYGVLELMDAAGERITQPGVLGEIVGTGFNNPVTPLIRYRTGDSTSFVSDGCAQCGRNFQIVTDVQGHYFQEMIVGADGTLTHVTAVNVHGDMYRNIRQYQVHQKEAGRITIRMVTSPEYGEADEAAVRRLVEERMPGMQVSFDYVDHIPATARGKWKYLIQELDTGLKWLDGRSG